MRLNEIEEIVPASENNDVSETEDMLFIIKCFKVLKKLGLIRTQYQFSEQFLNKNKYYYGMVLSEGRHPSVDSLHQLVQNINALIESGYQYTCLNALHTEG